MSFRISSLDREQREVVANNKALRDYLSRLERAAPPTPRSWLYEDKDPAAVLDDWMRQLRTLENGSETDKLIYSFDTKQLSKFGAQGGHPPVMEGVKVESFADQYEPSIVDPFSFRPLTDVLGLPSGSVDYRSFQSVLENMDSRDTLMTSSGWDQFTRRSKVVDISIEQALNGDAWRFPAILLFRTYNGKVRVVWMYPMSMNLLEFRATQPLQEAILHSTAYVTPWQGFEQVKKRFTELWAKHPYAFGGDTTAMDAHMQHPQLSAVAAASAPLFSAPKLMEDSLLHVADIDIVIGRNSIIRNQQHGVASGSGWTQLSETIFQICMFDEYIRSNNLPLTVDDGMGIGDDYVWFFDQAPESEKIVAFWEQKGLPGKPEKQSNDPNHCTFLQRLFIKGFFSRDDSTVLGGIYPTIRALNSILNPERYYNPKLWSSDAFCIRVYQILENVVDHPLFEEFIKFVVHGQKDLLPFAKQRASDINRIMTSVRNNVPGLTASYNQEKREKPLSEYASIRFAATL